MKQKSFDCIKMKRDIHERMLQELQGLSLKERLAELERGVLSDPMLADIWRKTRRIGADKEVSKMHS